MYNRFSVYKYSRLIKHKQVYVAESYNRRELTDFSVVCYSVLGEKLIGKIFTFVRITNCDCERNANCQFNKQHFAIVRELELEDVFVAIGDGGVTQNTFNFSRTCLSTDRVRAVPIDVLDSTCIYVKIENKTFVAIPINKRELE